MPKISLKPNSAEYDDATASTHAQCCEMPGCRAQAEHKAPKHRGLNEYYMFCLDHVREYNKAWNFFEGMANSEVEEHMINSLYGDRPTWKYGVNGDPYEQLYKKAWQTYNDTDEDPATQKRAEAAKTPELEALALMGLEPPVTVTEIKTRYKALVKKHHPDLNKGCQKSEELLKKINMAYTILKLAYEKYEDLPERQ